MKQCLLTKYEIPELHISKHGSKFDHFLTILYDSESPKLMKEAYNMSVCSQKGVWMNNGEYNISLLQTCDNRSCPHCAKTRAKKNNLLLKEYIYNLKNSLQADNIRFVTLTYDNVNDLKEFNFKAISKDLAKFRRTLQNFGYIIQGGYRVLEIKHSELKGFNIHLHLLYFAEIQKTDITEKYFQKFVLKHQIHHKDAEKYKLEKNKLATYEKAFYIKGQGDGYIDYKVLNVIWRESNHRKSFVTYPVILGRPKNGKILHGKQKVSAGINYLTKYMTKGFFEESYSVEVNVEIYLETRGIRYLQKFGVTFKGFKKSLYKLEMYHKEDVYCSEDGVWVAKENAKKFYFGLNWDCDFIGLRDIKWVRKRERLISS